VKTYASQIFREADGYSAQDARRKACKGMGYGDVGKDCEVNDRKFMDEIIRYVSDGGAIPLPSRLP